MAGAGSTAATLSADSSEQQQQQQPEADSVKLEQQAQTALAAAHPLQADAPLDTPDEFWDAPGVQCALRAAAAATVDDSFAAGRLPMAGYTLAAAALAALGAALAALAPQLTASGLLAQPASASVTGGTTVMIGCLGAALLRAAALCWFLRDGAARGELRSWRYQRANLALLTAAAAVALQQPLALGATSPLLLLPVLCLAAVAAAFCARVLLGCARSGLCFASALGEGDAGFKAYALGVHVASQLTTFQGVLLAALAAAGAAGAWQALVPGAGGAAAAGVLDAGGAYVWRLLGAGLLPLLASALLLLEPAAFARQLDTESYVKLAVVRQLEEQQRDALVRAAARAGLQGGALPPPRHVGADRFGALRWGLLVSLAVQAAWLGGAGGEAAPAAVAALGWEANNWVWAAQYWSCLAGGVYALALVGDLGWGWLLSTADAALGVVTRLVVDISRVLFVDWKWVEDWRRM